MKGSWGSGTAEEHIAFTPIVSGLREYAEVGNLIRKFACSASMLLGTLASGTKHSMKSCRQLCHSAPLDAVCRYASGPGGAAPHLMLCVTMPQALEAGGKPAPNAVQQLPSGQHIIDIFPTGCALAHLATIPARLCAAG